MGININGLVQNLRGFAYAAMIELIEENQVPNDEIQNILLSCVTMALIEVGIEIENPLEPTDEEAAALNAVTFNKYFAAACIYLLEALIFNITTTDEKLSEWGVWGGQYGDRLRRMLEEKRKAYENKYGNITTYGSIKYSLFGRSDSRWAEIIDG